MSYYGKTITNPAQGSNTDIDWNGSTGMFAVGGSNFRSQTVKLQHKVGDTWVDIGTDASFTASGGVLFTSSSSQVRVNVTGSGDPLVAVVEVKTVTENKAY
jgi:hypothetical protein|tara:strand:- start:1678 stop:1980 length:303 start_codon:yes stop_codon:yes gene_type:complete